MDRVGAVILFFLVLVAGVLLALDRNECSRCASGVEEEHRLYGTKTTYSDALRHISNGPNVTIPSSCQPVMLYLFKRHAIRYPDGEDIPDMESKLQRLKQRSLESHANGKSGLCSTEVEKLRNWEIKMKPEDDNLITASGSRETAEIASRMHDQFPGLLDPSVEFDIAISNRIRTNQTAFAFMHKLQEKTGKEMTFNPSVNLEWTDFHSICERHLMEQGVSLKKPELYNQFLKSEAMRILLSSVSRRLGLEDRSITAAEMKLIFRGCAFGHAIHGDSAWCSAFSKQELRLIELLEDVDDFYGDAYGRDVNQKAPCPVVRDLVTRLEDVVSKEESGEKGIRTFLRFSHAGAIKQLISYFGLFDELKTEVPDAVSACEREKWDSRSREWRSSVISPFSANMRFILYKCTHDSGSGIDYRLQTLVQESPVTVRGCASELCPLDQFLSHYRSAHQCNLKKICRI